LLIIYAGTLFGRRLHRKAPAMLLDQPRDDRQPQPSAAGLGAE